MSAAASYVTDTEVTGAEPVGVTLPNPVRRILVVDDSRAQRRILSSSLSRQGYEVIEAATGDEALAICREQDLDLILSDWMMPGMDGLELCEAFRALPREGYVYFILLTSKTDKGAVAQGLDVGADDFLAKPVNPDELRARINAGGRILSMERELHQTNRLVSSTLAEIQSLYNSLDRDLIEARKMQQSLVREKYRDMGTAEVSLLLKPCGHVGGDLVGFFEAGPDKLAFYSIDVSGHGIASALLTARLASYLSDGSPAHNIALEASLDGSYTSRPPELVAKELNALLLNDIQSEHYFTMLLGYIDLKTGAVDLSQCGHPNAVVLSQDGNTRFVGDGGMPIGLIDGATFQSQRLQLGPGDRLLFYSDGFTECADSQGRLLDEDGFSKLLVKNRDATNENLFDLLVWDLDAYSGGQDLGDDLSCVMVTYKPDCA
ncbi:fused response regulator/phosphatase [uncultured Aliiroseovarius sp.]|uniref:PP2C family protein-serine/threonine phosphatase n=1 Tax=uncultured Aliiroseovarius sp. TaxID=1658783 RepID=UPI00263451F8|nr:fused response regulator/phosphatase [uncultured Aliiroseovarius sp.]